MPELMHRVVPTSMVESEHITCPSCKGDTLVLEGFAQRRYSVELLNGVVVNEVLAEEPWQHEVKVIHCKRCEQVTEIVSQALWDAWQQAQIGRKPC